MRHDVYAQELRQHPTNSDLLLRDSLDDFNHYITAHVDRELAGFISITPPGFGKYSIDKYIAREDVPVPFDDGLYEFRILTVAKQHRSSRKNRQQCRLKPPACRRGRNQLTHRMHVGYRQARIDFLYRSPNRINHSLPRHGQPAVSRTQATS